MRLKQLSLFALILATLALSFFQVSLAKEDGEDHGQRTRYRERHRGEDHGRRYLKPVTDRTYKETCGACHFAYQPELLPSASWEKIVSRFNDHFGESFELDEETERAILSYLQTNAAEHSGAKRAVKIVRSMGTQVPIRITDIPYIKEKHHDISAATIKRQSIGSLSNCTACHLRAEEGIYDDDFAVVPK